MNAGLLTQFRKGLNLQGVRNILAHSSEVEHCPDKTGVEGSLPSVPTNIGRSSNGRTVVFETTNLGSIPSLPAKFKDPCSN